MSKLKENLFVQTILRLVPILSIGLALMIWHKYIDPEGQISTIKGTEGWYALYNLSLAFLLSSYVIVRIIFKKIYKPIVIPTPRQTLKVVSALLLTTLVIFFAWAFFYDDEKSLTDAVHTTLYELIIPFLIFVLVFGLGVSIYLGFKKLITKKI